MDSRAARRGNLDSEKLRSFIADYVGVDAQQVADDAHLSDDLGLDWLDQLELMVIIEDEFVGVDFFADTIATQIVSVGDLIRHIEQQNNARARRSAA